MHGFCIKTFPQYPSDITGKSNEGLFKDVLPAEASNYIFIKLDNFLCHVRCPSSALQKPLQVFMKRNSVRVELSISDHYPITKHLFRSLSSVHFIFSDLKCYGSVNSSSRNHL
jgi:hypothetical protein